MLKNFTKGFNGNYGVKLTPKKFRTLCELNWPAFGVEWPLEWSIDKIVVNEVYRVIVGKTGHPDQFADLTGCNSQLACMAKTLSGRNL
jgi:hypothetical protein